MRVIGGLVLLILMAGVTAVGQDRYSKTGLPLDDTRLLSRWKALEPVEQDRVALRNLHGLVRAMHQYHDVHGTFPPAEIPNHRLPPEKRLSGLVLLLPYLDDATYLHGGKEGSKVFDEKSAKAASELYRQIDLTRAWDDPRNLKAAKTLVPAFLLPGTAQLRTEDGLAVTHVALVRGIAGKDNGAFTVKPKRIDEILDGTSNTIALGQVQRKLGPWIAAGNSSSRYWFADDQGGKHSTFGSSIESGCYFVNADSFAYFLDTKKTSDRALTSLFTASAGDVLIDEGEIVRFDGMHDWKAKQGQPQARGADACRFRSAPPNQAKDA